MSFEFSPPKKGQSFIGYIVIAQTVLEETHTRTVRSCAWSPSGKLLATASFDGTTAIWQNFGDEFECISNLEVLTYSPTPILDL